MVPHRHFGGWPTDICRLDRISESPECCCAGDNESYVILLDRAAASSVSPLYFSFMCLSCVLWKCIDCLYICAGIEYPTWKAMEETGNCSMWEEVFDSEALALESHARIGRKDQ